MCLAPTQSPRPPIDFKLGLLLLLFLLLGCSNAKERPQTEARLAGSGEAQARPRAIALTPSLTELLYAFKDDLDIVATTAHSQWPEAVKGLEKIENHSSLERFLALKAELVLLHPSDQALAQKLESLGIQTLALAMDSKAGLEEAFSALGKRLNRREKAAAAFARLQAELQAVNEDFKARSQGPRPKSLLLIDWPRARGTQFFIAQKQAYLAELSRDCGLDLLEYGRAPWQALDAEQLIALNPEALIYFGFNPSDVADFEAYLCPHFPQLRACQLGKVLSFDDPSLSIPGLRIAKSMRYICQASQPLFD